MEDSFFTALRFVVRNRVIVINEGRNSGALLRKSTEEHFSLRWDLSRMTWIFTPRRCASTTDLATGALVKEYAWTRIIFFALPRTLVTGLDAATVWREEDLDICCGRAGDLSVERNADRAG